MYSTKNCLNCISVVVVSLMLISCDSSPSVAARSEAPAGDLSFVKIRDLGGRATSVDLAATSRAFTYPIPGLSAEELALHQTGDAHFSQTFVESSDSQYGHKDGGGLGPVYNNSSCIGCHNLDGRGSLPVGLSETSWLQLGQNESLFLKISVEDLSESEGLKLAPRPVPGFSTQLFHLGQQLGLSSDADLSLQGRGQAQVWVQLKKSKFVYPDGKEVVLSKPIFEIRNPYDVDSQWASAFSQSRLLMADVKTSPRMGMPMIGLGLLEAIPDSAILENAQRDRSSEGVHGQINWVVDVEKPHQVAGVGLSIGRFGLKATAPTVAHQSMGALNGDMGVTNFLFPRESIEGTDLFKRYDLKGRSTPEASLELSRSLIFYSQTLAVPPRRNIENSDVREGAQIFSEVRCTSCHVPRWQTGASPIAVLSNQTIYPFTDLLLHDMGEGLADGRRDFLASGRQWKTRPLWGIGLTKIVNPRAGFLHDGRADTLESAVLWHGGEAEFSKSKFVELPSFKRHQLIQFLQSL